MLEIHKIVGLGFFGVERKFSKYQVLIYKFKEI